ncbi:MAG: endonuclease/exonuclease/phosphatase family protein [Bacteroidales bacterium]|nr:endonuclease/exonuclease/phosphatase family protein [Bacteroidales bacterium]
MKKIFSLIAALAVAASAIATDLTVVTYNLRNENDWDAAYGNGWKDRLPVAAAQLQFIRPDVLGTQELKAGQVNDMLNAMPQYSYIGVAREDGKEDGEYSAIFYNRERISLIDSGNFWISETPDRPSKGWDAQCTRICTWGKFATADGATFFFFNMHMDHVGIIARREGGKLIVNKIKEIAGDGATVILSGDFNVDQSSEVYGVFAGSGILIDSYEAAHYRFAPNGTFNSFDPANTTTSRIDHIFVSNNVAVDRYGILTDMRWEADTDADAHKGNDAPTEINLTQRPIRVISDHYPVVVYLQF